MRPLEEILTERNPEVIHRFCEDFGVSLVDAEEIFIEMLRWLWLCAYRIKEYEKGRVDSPRIPLASQAQVIDLMWHTFLFFSKEYDEFCNQNFGFFIHHYPLYRNEKTKLAAELEKNPDVFKSNRLLQLKPMYEYIHDILGADVLVRWLETFSEKYARLKLTTLR